MPSKIIPCVLCGKQGRLARLKYTKICTTEREEKIREGYRRRRDQEFYVSLLYQQNSVLIDITNTRNKLYCDDDDNKVTFQTDGKKKRKKNLNFTSSNTLTHGVSDPLVIDLSDPDVSFIEVVQSDSTTIPDLHSLINIDHESSTNNLSYTQPQQHLNQSESDDSTLFISLLSVMGKDFSSFDLICSLNETNSLNSSSSNLIFGKDLITTSCNRSFSNSSRSSNK
ncbi:unnamed protein product [Rotaria sp. Silwood1]|nr:unnamed protein product [Rotaria sp. Silwood1]